MMSDLQEYVKDRTMKDAAFADNFEAGYANFKLGVLLRQAREASSLTQDDVALQLGIQKSIIAKIENHAEDIRLALLRRYAEMLGLNLRVSLS